MSNMRLSCAGFAFRNEGGILSYSVPEVGESIRNGLTNEQVSSILDLLEESNEFYTWGGTLFDFRVLANYGEWERCAKLAVSDRHYDLHLMYMAHNGHYLSLEKATKHLGLRKGYGEIRKGSDAPLLWNNGNRDTVLNYVRKDAEITLSLAEHMRASGCLVWTDNHGNEMTWNIRNMLSVDILMETDWKPSPGWVRYPINKNKILQWTKE